MDIQTVIERNRDPRNNTPSTQARTGLAPTMGILTRTVMGSPIVRWIIPARIRNKQKNDVVFIGVSNKDGPRMC